MVFVPNTPQEQAEQNSRLEKVKREMYEDWHYQDFIKERNRLAKQIHYAKTPDTWELYLDLAHDFKKRFAVRIKKDWLRKQELIYQQKIIDFRKSVSDHREIANIFIKFFWRNSEKMEIIQEWDRSQQEYFKECEAELFPRKQEEKVRWR